MVNLGDLKFLTKLRVLAFLKYTKRKDREKLDLGIFFHILKGLFAGSEH